MTTDANEGWRKVAEKYAHTYATLNGSLTHSAWGDFGRLVAYEQKRWYAAHGNWPQEWELLAAIQAELEKR